MIPAGQSVSEVPTSSSTTMTETYNGEIIRITLYLAK